MLADQTHVFLRCGVGRSGISWRFVGRGRVNRCLVVSIIGSSNGENSSENDKLKSIDRNANNQIDYVPNQN
jgi:hypothetical protein